MANHRQKAANIADSQGNNQLEHKLNPTQFSPMGLAAILLCWQLKRATQMEKQCTTGACGNI